MKQYGYGCCSGRPGNENATAERPTSMHTAIAEERCMMTVCHTYSLCPLFSVVLALRFKNLLVYPDTGTAMVH
jgi:hypothetical protein